jgi:ATP-dependent DNA helicase RecQ
MNHLLDLLRQALNNRDAEFREGQLEAISAILESPFRALVVQATGWGKSMVYFLATKVLREQGKGPTLVISPLLSLMRNQVDAANNLGLRAEYYTSANTGDWKTIELAIERDEIDLLLISPERLANESFQTFIASSALARVGLIVIDEAHCISDWGHDFRPDYQRLGELIRRLPVTTSVIATTATANERVVNDIQTQIGANIQIIRGSLARHSLRVQVMPNKNAAERLAWLDSNLNQLPGSGIIYVLTVRDAERVASWLQQRGHAVEAYHSQTDSEQSNHNRQDLERTLLENRVKALVSTVALGMGFDKPDLGFVVHFQSPGNLVAYYQQIGRAGRAIEDAVAVLFLGYEDVDIHRYFVSNARAPQAEIEIVLQYLDRSENGLKVTELTELLNLTKSEVSRVLKQLCILNPAPVIKSGSSFKRTPVEYVHDSEKEALLSKRRLEEMERFEQFSVSDRCFMEMVRQELDDPLAEPCGKCSNCVDHPIVSSEWTADSLEAALAFLGRSEFLIEPRKRWPKAALPSHGFNGNIPVELQCSIGMCLSQFGDPGLAEFVRSDKHSGYFRDELVGKMIEGLGRVFPEMTPDWICAVPSLRSEALVPDFSFRLASAMGIPYVNAVKKIKQTEPQKDQRNSFHQAANLDGAFEVSEIRGGTVLLIDDMVDSQWTFTIIGALLLQAGAGKVIPIALTSTRNRGTDE